MSSAVAPEQDATGTAADITTDAKPADATPVVAKPEAAPRDTPKAPADKPTDKPADAPADTRPRNPDGTFAPNKVPDTYKLTLPEKSTLDASALERTAAIARELGLPDDATAQKVVNLVNQEVATREAALLADHAPGGAAWTKQVDAWRAETLANPALGKTPEERTAAIQKGHLVIQKFGEAHPERKEAITTFLNNSGLGDHPVVNELFAWLGKAAGESPLIAANGGTTGTVPVAQRLYPTMNP